MTVARSPATTDFFEDLLDAAAHGDPRALDALNRRYIGRLTAAARSMGAIDPEGAANQALFDGIRSIGTLRSRHEAPFRRYLHACVANQVRSEHRIQRPSLVALDPAVHGAAPWLDPAELVVGRGWFDAALEELPSEQRAVIRERFEVGRTVAETASTLGKTNDSVKHLQARGLRRIGRFLTAAGLVAVLIALGFLAAQHRRTLQRIEPANVPPPLAPELGDPERSGEGETGPARRIESGASSSSLVPPPLTPTTGASSAELSGRLETPIPSTGPITGDATALASGAESTPTSASATTTSTGPGSSGPGSSIPGSVTSGTSPLDPPPVTSTTTGERSGKTGAKGGPGPKKGKGGKKGGGKRSGGGKGPN